MISSERPGVLKGLHSTAILHARNADEKLALGARRHLPGVVKTPLGIAAIFKHERRLGACMQRARRYLLRMLESKS